MSQPARALSRALDRFGQPVVLRRTVSTASFVDVTVRARITGYTSEELESGIAQGDRKTVVSAADVQASGFPLPIRSKADAIMVGTRRFTIQSVDDFTRRVAGELIAYELGLAG